MAVIRNKQAKSLRRAALCKCGQRLYESWWDREVQGYLCYMCGRYSYTKIRAGEKVYLESPALQSISSHNSFGSTDLLYTG